MPQLYLGDGQFLSHADDRCLVMIMRDVLIGEKPVSNCDVPMWDGDMCQVLIRCQSVSSNCDVPTWDCDNRCLALNRRRSLLNGNRSDMLMCYVRIWRARAR